MEVHHHPDLHHKGKKLKEYFIEFLMIFLAVVMGFMAENLREQFTDGRRTHQFAKSLVHDLEIHAQKCNSIVLAFNRQVSNYDTLMILLNSNNASTNKLYYFFQWTTRLSWFTSTRTAIDQLKSTGAMRLFEKRGASDTINSYYESAKWIEDYSSIYINYFNEFHKDAFQAFSYSQLGSLFFEPEKLLNNSLKLKLLNDNYTLKQILYNKLFALRTITSVYTEHLKD
jgi:hypothetical protein